MRWDPQNIYLNVQRLYTRLSKMCVNAKLSLPNGSNPCTWLTWIKSNSPPAMHNVPVRTNDKRFVLFYSK